MVEERKPGPDDWSVVPVKARIDYSTQTELLEEIRRRVSAGHLWVALDLRSNRFLSLPAIKGCVEIARELKARGGALALAYCPERSRRHFEIYGSLENIRVLRSELTL